jgi:hypothetical protein
MSSRMLQMTEALYGYLHRVSLREPEILAKLRALEPIRQSAGEVIIIPVGAPHAIIARTENWSVVIRSREMETAWRNWYDAEAGTVERKVFGYG